MSSKVRQANKPQLSAAHLAGSLLSDPSFVYDFKVAASSDLLDDERDVIWNILADNMRDLYLNSSLGWNPPAKKRELFSRWSRFILVRHRRHNNEEDTRQVAFIMFRFEHENNEDVVYCYEIQVCPSARRNGLGKMLLQQVSSIGAHQGMCKVMLTVFKANSDAMKFYQASGFMLDPTSPNYVSGGPEWLNEGGEEIDYKILSKPISQY